MGVMCDVFVVVFIVVYDDFVCDEKYVVEYDYYLCEWVLLYIDWCCKVGWDLYGLLNIGCDEKVCMYV